MTWPPFPAPRLHDPAQAQRLLSGESLLLSYHLKTLRDMLVEQLERPDLSLGREALARLLGERLLDAERLRRALTGLSAEERYLLACIKDAGGQLMPDELLQQAARAGVAAAPRALERLVLLGLALFPFNPHPRLRRQERYRADRPEAPLWLHPLVLSRTESSAYIPARLPPAGREPARIASSQLQDFLSDLLLVWQGIGLQRPRLLRTGQPAARLAKTIAPLLTKPGAVSRGLSRASAGSKPPADVSRGPVPRLGAGSKPPVEVSTEASTEAAASWAGHPRLSLLLSLTRHEGWIVAQGGRLESAPGRPAQALCGRAGHEIGQHLLESWLRLASYQEIRHLPGLTLERELEFYATGRERFQDRLQLTRAFLLARLQQCPPLVWIAVDTLLAYARQIAPDLLWPLPQQGGPARYRRLGIEGLGAEPPREGNWDRVEGALLRHMLDEVLHPLGMIDLGEPGLFRITSAGAYALGTGPEPPPAVFRAGRPAAILQPNYDLLVFRDRIAPTLYETLLSFARKERGDALDHLRLDRAGIEWGQDRGLSADQMRSALEAATGQPPSQNVAYSLVAWCRRRGSVLLIRHAALGRERPGGPWKLTRAPVAAGPGPGRDDPRSLVIKPDGQILADLALLDPVTEAYLNATCRPLWRDEREAAYELDPQALAQGAAAGRVHPASLIARLAARSRTEMPARQRLRWWTAAQPGTTILLDPHLHTPMDSPVVDWLIQIPAVRSLVERSPRPRPRAGRRRELRRLLKTLDLKPQAGNRS